MPGAKHTIVALVQDKPGVLNRVASLFRRRGFNIESIAVGQCEIPHLARLTIVIDGTTTVVEQVRKQLDKVIDVVRVSDITGDEMVTRKLALIKVKASAATRSEIMQIVDIFRANIVDVSADSVTVEVTGDEAKIESLIKLLSGFGLKELATTGRLALTRGTLSPLTVEREQPKGKAKR